MTITREEAIQNAQASTKDFYAELTDEERAEEGLPPREGAKPPDAAAPAAENQPVGDPEEGDDDEEGEEEEIEDLGDEAAEALFNEITGMRQDLNEALGKKPADKEARDELIEAALEHEDPVVRRLAERLQDAEKRLDAHDQVAQRDAIDRQLKEDDADFDAIRNNYTIAGKPLTDRHIEKIENYILKNPEAGRFLTIEEVARRVLPTAVKGSPKPPPAKGPGGSQNGKQPRVATIVDEGSSGGTPAGPWQPRANETVESAVKAAGERLFGIKR